tara:strand:+ start:89 stop:520 length:432 start_codon:yes stop_codon:yes gene_type:complete
MEDTVLFTNEGPKRKGTTTIFLSELFNQDDAYEIKRLSSRYFEYCERYKHEYKKMTNGVYSCLNKMGLIRVFGVRCIKEHVSGYKLFNKYLVASNQRKWRPLKQSGRHKTMWYPYGNADQLMQYMGEDFEKFLKKQNTKYCIL